LQPPLPIAAVVFWTNVPKLGNGNGEIAVNQSQSASTGAGKIPDRQCQYGVFLRATFAG
jgi:hypothetical protein